MQGWKIDKSKLTLKIYMLKALYNFRLILGLSSEVRDISFVIDYFALACTRPWVQTKGSNKSGLLCLDRQESHVQSWNGSESPK